MASLPPGWTADYDGQRWFFIYGPTGQWQFQFPRPGDEFPDLGFGGGGVVLPAVELSPEERLESERQVRRVSGASGGSTGRGTRGGEVKEEGGPREESGGDVAGPVCFGNFAAVSRSRGRRVSAAGSRGEETRNLGQSGRRASDGVATLTTNGGLDASGESSSNPISAPFVIKGDHSKADTAPRQRAGSTPPTISIMGEPVLAVAQTAAGAPSLGQQGEQQPAIMTQPSSPELPISKGRAEESTKSQPWVLTVGVIPELYSESTALCAEEMNPPPVELPANEEDCVKKTVIPHPPVQSVFELPANEWAGASPGKGDSAAAPEPKSLAGDYAATPRGGRGEEAPGASGRGHDHRASLPSQALKKSPPEEQPPPNKISRRGGTRGRVNSAPDQRPPLSDTGQPAAGRPPGAAERRVVDLSHFPSVLRPGPRRSGAHHRHSVPLVPAPPPVTTTTNNNNTAHAATSSHVRSYQQPPPRGGQEREQKFEVEATRPVMSKERSASMPEMPFPSHRYEPQRTTALTDIPEVLKPGGGARQDRLPGSGNNFVLPIRHRPEDDKPRSAFENTALVGPPGYRTSEPSASSARSLEEQPPRVAGAVQASGEIPGSVPERRAESSSWGLRASQAGPARLVGGRSAPGLVQEWGWGWAR